MSQAILPYHIQLLEPLLVTSLSGDPNSSVSYDFIPGSAIRGMVAAILAKSDKDLAIQKRALLFNGTVRYLNGYLKSDKQGRQTLPAPQSWRVNKLKPQDTQIFDLAVEKRSLGSPKGVGGYVLLDGDKVEKFALNRSITVHTQRDRFAGKPGSAFGEIYRYDAIAPKQYFSGFILADDATYLQVLQQSVIEGHHHLGGARSSGYGLVNLSWGAIRTGAIDVETKSPIDLVSAGTILTVTLLSDAILRNQDGMTYTNLCDAINLALACDSNESVAFEAVNAFKKTNVVGGFNRKWGLPLSQETAVSAGSVFVLKAQRAICKSEIESLIWQGVGERRVEGFGRLAINWQEHSPLSTVSNVKEYKKESSSKLDGKSAELAKRMANRWARQKLDSALILQVDKLTQHVGMPLPSNSQLARVRVVLRSALQEGNSERVKALFVRAYNNGNSNSRNAEGAENSSSGKIPGALAEAALKRFESAWLGTTRLSDWIPEILDANIIKILGGDDMRGGFIGGFKPNKAFVVEYRLRLIDGVLARLMTIQKQGGENAKAS